MANEAIAEAYGQMLSEYPWQWFLTLTFRPSAESASGGMHPEKADKAFRFLISNINRDIWGPRWHKKPEAGIFWARGQEFHKSGRIHFHAVAAAEVDLNERARRLTWMDFWFKHFGIARIEKPTDQGDVAHYVSKYVTKDGEIDFSPNLHKYLHAVKFSRE